MWGRFDPSTGPTVGPCMHDALLRGRVNTDLRKSISHFEPSASTIGILLYFQKWDCLGNLLSCQKVAAGDANVAN